MFRLYFIDFILRSFWAGVAISLCFPHSFFLFFAFFISNKKTWIISMFFLSIHLNQYNGKAAARISRSAHYIFPFINQTNMASMLVSSFDGANHQLQDLVAPLTLIWHWKIASIAVTANIIFVVRVLRFNATQFCFWQIFPIASKTSWCITENSTTG